jgi:hypothetical protein
MATIDAIKDLDYYDRCELSDSEETDFTNKEGYYLKDGNKLPVAVLPDSAEVILRLIPENAASYARHVSFPPELRGCVFAKAPHLVDQCAEIIRYWSGETVNSNIGGAAYYQNPNNCYLVDLSAIDAMEDSDEQLAAARVDALLSEGVVIRIVGLGQMLGNAQMDQFVEIEIPVDESMLGQDNAAFRSDKPYDQRAKAQSERIFLNVSDILASPNPDDVLIDVLRFEGLDYGFHF